MPDKVDEEVLDIKEAFDKAQVERAAMERQCYYNYAAYMGFPIKFTKSKGGLYVQHTSQAGERSQAYFNLIYQAVRIVLSKLTSDQPVPVILPSSRDPEDLVTTRVAQRWASWVWTQKQTWCGGMPRRGIQGSWIWAIIGGTSIIGTYYNPEKDTIELEPMSIFEIYPQRGKRALQDCEYVDRVFKRNRAYLKSHYPKVNIPDLEKAEETSSEAGITNYQQQINDILTTTPGSPGGARPTDLKLYTICERWYPYKRVVGLVNTKEPITLVNEENEYGEIPFVQLDYEFVPDRWNGKSPIDDCIAPNVIYSFIMASEVDLLKIAMNPPILEPMGCELAERKSVKPGEHITYNAIEGKPEFMSPPQEPVWIPEYKKELQQLIYANFGIFEASQGKMPPGASGRALSRMYAFDEGKFGPIMARAEESYAAVYQQILNRAKLIGTDVTFRTLGKVGRAEIMVFKKTQMKKVYSVISTSGTLLESDKANQREILLKLADTSVGQAIGPKKILQMFNIPVEDDDFDPEGSELALIDLENSKLLDGKFVDVYPYHNHGLHVVHHNQLRLSPSWDGLDTKIKALVEGHIKSHQMIADRMAEMEAKANPKPTPVPGITGGGARMPGAGPGQPADITKPNQAIAEPLMAQPGEGG